MNVFYSWVWSWFRFLFLTRIALLYPRTPFQSVCHSLSLSLAQSLTPHPSIYLIPFVSQCIAYGMKNELLDCAKAVARANYCTLQRSTINHVTSQTNVRVHCLHGISFSIWRGKIVLCCYKYIFFFVHSSSIQQHQHSSNGHFANEKM